MWVRCECKANMITRRPSPRTSPNSHSYSQTSPGPPLVPRESHLSTLQLIKKEEGHRASTPERDQQRERGRREGKRERRKTDLAQKLPTPPCLLVKIPKQRHLLLNIQQRLMNLFLRELRWRVRERQSRLRRFEH